MDEKMDEKKPAFWFSVRFLMGILLFFGYCFNYMQKIDMSIAIVCMINQTALNLQMNSPQSALLNISRGSMENYSLNQTILDSTDKCAMAKVAKKATHDGPFVWPKSIQGMILSAYFYGYILTQIPGGWLSFRFGGKIVLGLSMGIGSAITMLIPLSAKIHYWALIVCLFFTGAAHGSFWPSVSSFWAYWAPDTERSRLVGMASSGAKVGNIIALSLGSVLCLHGFAGGWPSIFYIFGSMGVIWSVLFFILSTDSPGNHWFIRENEKSYVLSETKKTIALKQYCQSNVPWKRILTSKACWSIFIGHFSHNWGNYLFLTQTPSFLKDVLKFDLKSNGFVASIPYIASWVFINMSSVIVDKVIRSKKVSRTTARRIFSLLGLVLPGITIIALSFVNCTVVVLGVIILTLGVAFDSIMMGAGYLVNINDIAGPYSGIVFGLSNTIATLPGIISPNLASLITKHGYQSEWQIVFIISAIVYFVGAVINFWLLDGNIQPWAKIEDQNKDAIEIVDQDKKPMEQSVPDIPTELHRF